MLIVGLSIFIVLIDLVLKSISTNLVNNPGLAFGLAFISPLTVAILHFFLGGALLIYARKVHPKKLGKLIIFITLVSGSNLIDRVVFGYVRDYIHVFNFSVNLADIAINLGVLCIIYILLVNKEWTSLQSTKKIPEKD